MSPMVYKLAALIVVAAVALLSTAVAWAAPPVDERSRTVLSINSDLLILSWDYYLTGDYNQNGLVEVADLTPLGVHFNKQGAFAAESIESVVDGNDDGLIGVSDITPIGQNWDCGVAAYNIYHGANLADWPAGGEIVASVDFNPPTPFTSHLRLSFSFQLTTYWLEHYYWVRPVHEGAEGIASEPVQLIWPTPAGSGQIDVRVASDSCGEGGELGVRIFAPEATATHFPAGAPVIVHVAGGTSFGGIKTAPTIGLEGFIEISYYMPGSGPPEEGSDGVFDNRGQLCIDALRDVIRYALGELKDSEGWTLQELTAANVLYDNVGVLPSSNGGPLTVVTMAQYGEQFSDLAWYVGFENPTCSQCVMPDAGPGTNDVGQLPLDYELIHYANPEYSGPQLERLDIDYTAIAYDEFILIPDHGMLYLERGGLPRFDVTAYPGGGFTADLDHDGQIGIGEDWGFGFWRVDDMRFYSLGVIEAVWDNAVFTLGSEPAWLPTVAEADAFWELRDATLHYGEVAAKLPDLKVIVLGTVVDHVQGAPDKPHLWQAFHGWHDNGVWVKLNPSREAFIDYDPALSGHPGLPDVPANTEPADWTDPQNYIPENVPGGTSVGVIEVATLVEEG